MPTKKLYARIAITLPKQDLAAADRLARAQDRSRSWIVAEAIRRYASSIDAPPRQVGSPVGPADETLAVAPMLAGPGASRLAQLRSDFSLTPEARVRAAEETLLLTEKRETSRAHQVVAFDRYEDFLDWKRMRGPRR